MIQFVRHEDIRKLKWDACIENSQFPTIYAMSWYLDVVAPNWCALIEDDYVSVMPLPIHRKYFINYVYQPFYTQQLGLFHSPHKKYNIVSYIKQIPKDIHYISFNLNEKNSKCGRFSTSSRNYLLDLGSNYTDLKNNYSPYTRRNLKKFYNQQLIIDDAISVDEIVSFMLKNPVTKTLTSNAKLTLSLFKKIKEYNKAFCYGARDNNGELIAILYIMKSFNRYINILETTNDRGREFRCMFGLLDNFIKLTAGNKVILDFEGSNILGIARFFEGFGAYPVIYPHLHINKLPPAVRWLKP